MGDANEVDIERAAAFSRDLRFMETGIGATASDELFDGHFDGLLDQLGIFAAG